MKIIMKIYNQLIINNNKIFKYQYDKLLKKNLDKVIFLIILREKIKIENQN